jgi:glycosyltransferase involved in cell wall biosynthesis
LGRRDRLEVLELLRGARMLVCPSEWYEPLAFVAIEALAAGVPPVVSSLGGFRELIDHGRTGLHVRAGDASDLAQAVVWLARDLSANQRLGRAARKEYLARYTPDRNYETLMEVYGRALARRARSAA